MTSSIAVVQLRWSRATARNDPAHRWPIVDSPGIGDLDYVNDRAHAEARALRALRHRHVPYERALR
jgi:hypothetical protein